MTDRDKSPHRTQSKSNLIRWVASGRCQICITLSYWGLVWYHYVTSIFQPKIKRDTMRWQSSSPQRCNAKPSPKLREPVSPDLPVIPYHRIIEQTFPPIIWPRADCRVIVICSTTCPKSRRLHAGSNFAIDIVHFIFLIAITNVETYCLHR